MTTEHDSALETVESLRKQIEYLCGDNSVESTNTAFKVAFNMLEDIRKWLDDTRYALSCEESTAKDEEDFRAWQRSQYEAHKQALKQADAVNRDGACGFCYAGKAVRGLGSIAPGHLGSPMCKDCDAKDLDGRKAMVAAMKFVDERVLFVRPFGARHAGNPPVSVYLSDLAPAKAAEARRCEDGWLWVPLQVPGQDVQWESPPKTGLAQVTEKPDFDPSTLR